MTKTAKKTLLSSVVDGCAAAIAVGIFCAPSVGAQAVSSAEVLGLQSSVDFSADKITYNAETGDVRALGQVVLKRDGFTLLAGEIRYNEQTGKAVALGAVELQLKDGSRIVAPRLEMNDNLKSAFVQDIRFVMTDGGQVAAAEGSYDQDKAETVLKRAVYSPCKVCIDDPDDEPVWQIKAVKVTHDKNKRRLYYKDAFLEFLGVPVLWTPTLSHPDPTVDRASGFLPFEIKTNKHLGLVLGAPYHHVFSKSKDMTVTPILTTQEGLVVTGEYRQRFSDGQLVTDGSITYADKRDQNNIKSGGQEFRGNISAEGYFNHSDTWRSTFDLNWASDDTYLRRYDFSDADTLVNDYKFEGFYGSSYISARALAFQGLRLEDVTGLTAFALPLIDAEFIPDYRPLGGVVRIEGNALALHRLDGLDTQRVTAAASWERRFVSSAGVVLDVNASVRSDAYNIDDIEYPDDPAYVGNAESDVRTMARLSGRFSWPLVKYGETNSHTIEPIVEVTVAPTRRNAQSFINEDSRSFELTDRNIFSLDRPTGYDLYEDGSRVTYGFRWQYDGEDVQTEVMLGQSWQVSGDYGALFTGTGLDGDSSDIVGRTQVSYRDWLFLDHRYRLDDSKLAVRRNDIDLTIGNEERSVTLGYFKLNRDLTDFVTGDRADREEIRATGSYRFYKNWHLSGGVIQDLTSGFDGVEYNIGASYKDECIEIGLQFRETYTRDRDIVPGTSILFRLKLKNLG
ncbi:LPS-assembly protein LptD [Kordiimonas sediminis]|uniref:LPS-assembly protein LptD n=1 Tax=Kordiimonas sediminis TaxID=1735581 RepID=A0A919EA45_9PROT|nr:LPS assembly protein LptD [Kordiimonas sediminis]GHF27650.1 LPS-assembly protein LptD [Kordiimonas sediminis]